MVARPEVQRCYGVAGRTTCWWWLVRDLSAYDAFCPACLSHDATCESSTTRIVLDAAKC